MNAVHGLCRLETESPFPPSWEGLTEKMNYAQTFYSINTQSIRLKMSINIHHEYSFRY